MCNCSFGCPSNPIERRWIGSRTTGLRRRTGFQGWWGVHENGPSTWSFTRGFALTMDDFIGYLDTQLVRHRWASSSIDWIGCAGTVVCKSGYHPRGRALDITRITLQGGKGIDMNVAWRPSQPLSDRRLYLAIIAAARMHSSHVLTAYWRNRSGSWDTSHDNHIHIDNARGQSVGSGPEPLSRGSEADTILVQLACNWLVNTNLVIDGQFGPQTTQAYRKLRGPRHLDATCLRPYGNYWGMVEFLHLIVQTAVANRHAGPFKASCR